MHANKRRGEIAAELNGEPYKLRLTLGSLAELEAAYEVDDLAALVERFSGGRLAARDLIRLVGAGLRGAGYTITDDEVAAMDVPEGIAGFARLASALLEAAFGEDKAPAGEQLDEKA
ncbi:MAG: gene transfer agent family protein [Rhizobiaceae bacterium]|nr:gene transfer agent family protein [Rhizobiaceae bacterium]